MSSPRYGQANVVLVLAGCGGCWGYCGACRWRVWWAGWARFSVMRAACMGLRRGVVVGRLRQVLTAGRDGIAAAGGVVAGWGGVSASAHRAAGGGRVLALDNVIGADGATGSGFGGAADVSQSGRNGMTGVVDDTRRGVAAIAPSTDTPAGRRQLVDHLQLELDRAKSLLKVSEQRNVMLARLIRGGAGRYGAVGSRTGGGAMAPMMGGMPVMGGMSPISLAGAGSLSGEGV